MTYQSFKNRTNLDRLRLEPKAPRTNTVVATPHQFTLGEIIDVNYPPKSFWLSWPDLGTLGITRDQNYKKQIDVIVFVSGVDFAGA